MSRILFLASLLAALAAEAQSVCEVAKPMDGQRLLRRLSLDLRGYSPSAAEQLAQSGQSQVDPAIVDQYLASPDFTQVMRSYHKDLLWPNLSQVQIGSEFTGLIPYPMPSGNIVYWAPLRGILTRTTGVYFYPCLDQPATYDANGNLVKQPLVVNGQTVAYQEGWVMVEPYWAPGTQVKVCALDAQPALTGTYCPSAVTAQIPYLKQICDQFAAYTTQVGIPFEGAPVSCDSSWAILAPDCGCGPNLRTCMAVGDGVNTPNTLQTIQNSLIEQELRVIDDVVGNDQPYTNVLTTKQASINGPLAHYLTYQSRASDGVFGELDQTSPIPAGITYADPNWTPITRTGRHAGVLTTPGYLLRFQSNRGRAHRFYNAFQCADFIPSGPLPSPFAACSQHQDLTLRCGCNACHGQLEPMAASWGRYAEYGLTPLDDNNYPINGESMCTNLTSFADLLKCARFYLLSPVGDQLPYQGMLLPYVFRTAPQVAQLEQGPSSVAQAAISSGSFATCTARKMWSFFMRRQPTADEEANVIPTLASNFSAGGYHLRSLAKAIVLNPAYGRLP